MQRSYRHLNIYVFTVSITVEGVNIESQDNISWLSFNETKD